MTQQPKMALLIAEPHKNNHDYVMSDAWKNFLLNMRQFLPPTKKTERIAENIWQIPLDTELHFLAVLIEQMKHFGVPIRILFFEKSPDWLRYPPSA